MDKFNYPLPEPIYINRQRQQERASAMQGVLGAALIVMLLMAFGISIAEVMS